MTWEDIIERERISIGRPIRVVGRSVIRREGIEVKTLMYKPDPTPDPTSQREHRFGHYYRVSTWITEKDGTFRHCGSSSSNIEWKDTP